MIIFNAGVPRSGTVLVNSIVRHLLSDVTQSIAQANPTSAELLPLLQRIISKGEDKIRPCLIHTHSWSPEVAALLAPAKNARIMVNYRDPRDVTVSLMKLHELDLEKAVRLTEASFAQMAACMRDANTLVFPYELLVAGKQLAIFRIAQLLGIRPSMRRISAIDDETSVVRHRSVMEDVQSGSLKTVIRRNTTKRVLVEDKVTLINDRHIQSGAVGRWRSELSGAQQDQITNRFGQILDQFGYERH